MYTLVVLVSLLTIVNAGRYGGSSGRSRGGDYGHSYPKSTGLSGNSGHQTHDYPRSHGLSGTNYHSHSNTYNNRKTEVHHHYHYNPPQQITYGSVSHPVYHGSPPVYVYEYRNSGSPYSSLLTGLALYNLGRMSTNHHYDSSRQYNSRPGEICKLGISKSNGEYEETRIDCKLMSSFIWDAESQQNSVSNVKTVTTTTNTTNNNGTVVTTGSKQVVDALQVKGPSIQVTPGMNCFMIRISRDSSILKRKVECGLLQTYASRSLYHNSSNKMSLYKPYILMIIILVIRNKL